jgi:hypothetical protein
MIKKIQRLSDLKFLLSLENDIWVDNIKESKSFQLNEFDNVKQTLLTTYQENGLKVYTNYQIKAI